MAVSKHPPIFLLLHSHLSRMYGKKRRGEKHCHGEVLVIHGVACWFQSTGFLSIFGNNFALLPKRWCCADLVVLKSSFRVTAVAPVEEAIRKNLRAWAL